MTTTLYYPNYESMSYLPTIKQTTIKQTTTTTPKPKNTTKPNKNGPSNSQPISLPMQHRSLSLMIAMVMMIIAATMMVTIQGAKWPVQFRQGNYQQYSPTFDLTTSNWPVAEGDDFLLDVEFKDLVINHKANRTDIGVDVMDVVLSTRFISEEGTDFTKTTTIRHPLNNTSAIKALPISFPVDDKTKRPASSHKITFSIAVNEIKNTTTVNTLFLTKKDKPDTTFELEKPYTISLLNKYQIASGFDLEVNDSNAKKISMSDRKHRRSFNMLFDNITIDSGFALQGSEIAIRSNATRDFAMVGDSTKTKDCILSWGKEKTDNATSALYAFKIASDDKYVFRAVGATTTLPEKANATFSCDNTFEFTVNGPSFDKHEALTIGISLYDGLDEEGPIYSNAILIDPITPKPTSWIRAGLVIGGVMVIIAVIWIIAMIVKKKQAGGNANGSIQEGLLSDHDYV